LFPLYQTIYNYQTSFLILDSAEDNPKLFWQYIKSKTKTNYSRLEKNPDGGDGDENMAVEDQDKAEVLNLFFSSVFTNEPEGTLPTFDQKANSQISDLAISQEKLKLKLLNLNPAKAPGPDNLHPRVLKSESESDEYSVVSSWNSLHEGVQMCERDAGSHRFVKNVIKGCMCLSIYICTITVG
jgi:hypothetical protein